MNIHVASQKLDLESDNRLGNPDCREDAAEDERTLVVAGVDGQEEGEQQTEEQWTPAHHVSTEFLHIA